MADTGPARTGSGVPEAASPRRTPSIIISSGLGKNQFNREGGAMRTSVTTAMPIGTATVKPGKASLGLPMGVAFNDTKIV
jgi:hypothetical protein